uniref:RNA helicase n=1 Tax=Branchiostoma floridae TaxID=7739 RepID=C3Y4L5_BRAFL|eukprot:XP_002608662.1 hypothetical protein BRAFLDRAFT_211958 [Branchiostoma floridae]
MKYSFPSTDTTSDVEPDMRQLVTAQNKKKKKSGGFQSMGLSHGIFKGVMKKGYKVPTPIQRKCIPIIMDGKDVVAMARTGSGKTAAFLIPMFEKLRAHSTSGARALILAPTRELALQTMKFTKELGRFTGLRAALILGGDSMEDQFAALHENPDICIFLVIVCTLVSFEYKKHTIDMYVSPNTFVLSPRPVSSAITASLSPLVAPAALEGIFCLVYFALVIFLEPVSAKTCKPPPATYIICSFSTWSKIRSTDGFVLVHCNTLKYIDFHTTGLSCSAVYSSLDQTARKINIAKFTHKKTKVMLVTDIAARGIDIPMLDNVINYNFPCKPKLFVHRVGRVARAGRSGTAYSLVAPDETPLMLDLHLFLGRAVKVAGKDKSSEERICVPDWDGLYGKVPQSIIDDEDANIRVYQENNLELGNLKRVSEWGYSAYLKSRSAPSHESVKRMKGMDTAQMGFHPLLGNMIHEVEDKLAEFVDGVRNYKPNSTIFEVSASNKNPAFSVMKSKRSVHQGVIRRLQDQKSSKQDIGGAAAHTSNTEMTSEQDIEVRCILDTFSTVVAPGHKRKHAEDDGNVGKKQKQGFRDEEHFLPYRPQDHHSEKGLGLESSFQVQASDAMLDLAADEAEKAKQQKNQLKWDRKKKKFVKEGIDLKKKKIKTESGTWVSASFKTDSYKRWLQQSKMREQEREEEENEQDQFGGKRKDGQQPRNQGGARRPRSELKSTDQILKSRIKKEREQAFQGARQAIKQKRRAIAGDKRH